MRFGRRVYENYSFVKNSVLHKLYEKCYSNKFNKVLFSPTSGLQPKQHDVEINVKKMDNPQYVAN